MYIKIGTILVTVSVRSIVGCLIFVNILFFSFLTLWTLDDPLQLIRVSRDHSCDCEHSHATTAIIYMQKPRRPFHGNHWYHIGEYYLSRHKQIQTMLHNTSYTNVVLLTHDTKLTRMMTKFTFFLSALSVSLHDGSDRIHKLQNIELFSPLTKSKIKDLKQLQLNCDSNRNRSDFCINTPFIWQGGGPLYRYSGFSHNNGDAGAIQSSPPVRATSSRCRCGHYVGSIGAYPIETTHWFAQNTTKDTAALRNAAMRMCRHYNGTTMRSNDNGGSSGSGDGSMIQQYQKAVLSGTSGHSRTYKLLIYERDKNRRFADLLGTIKAITAALGSQSSAKWSIDILNHREGSEPCAIHNALRGADIFLTAHGFQCTGTTNYI